MLRSVMTVGGWTMASRILGFARDMLIASRLGAGPVADAFFVALKLPYLFRRLFGEGAFNAAFVPAFAGTLATEGRAAAQALAERMAALMAIWLGTLVALGLVFMPWIMRALAPGFIDEPAKFQLAIELTRITFPYLFFICLTALVAGVLNGLDRFAAAAAAPIFFNVISMMTLLWLTPYVATPGHALAWGVTLSGIAQLALVLWAAAQAGMALNILRPPAISPEVKLVLRRMIPGVIGAGVVQLNLAVDIIIASLLPSGAVSFLYYADRVAQLPLGVIGAAVGTALLPLLARQLRSGQKLSAHRSMNRAIEMSLLLTLPAAAGLAAAATPIIAALFERGAFGPVETVASSRALVAYAIGLPAFVLIKVFAPAFFARGDTATPVKLGLFAVALNLAFNLVLMGPLQHAGVALATSLSAWVNAALLALVLMRRRQLLLDRRLRRSVPRLVLASAAMAAIVVGVGMLMPPAASALARAGIAAVVIGAGAATFSLIAVAIGAIKPRETLRMFRRRRGA